MASGVLGVWLGCISVVPTTVRESAPPDPKENKQADAGSRLFSKAVFVQSVVVERVDPHGLLRGGAGGKHRAIQGAIVNVQYSIDEYICAACVTTHAHGFIHRVQQYVYLPASW